MAKVQIFLEEGESIDQAQDTLFKALKAKRTGDSHISDAWDDDLMVVVEAKMVAIHEALYVELLKEIKEVLLRD